jgi:sugar O-acyltransferase (sialic acid O-acetyltransferase NeuD family)
MTKDKNTKIPLILLGAGGHAKVLIEILKFNQAPILGLTDSSYKQGEKVLGIEVLGGDEIIYDYPPKEILLINGIGGLPERSLRWKLAEQFKERGYRFATIVDPSAVIASDVELADGVQVMAGVVLQPNVKVGMDSIINTSAVIEHDCNIGDSCHIAPSCTLSGGVNVGNKTHVGVGTNIIQGINIGVNSVVGAGSIVLHDVADNVKLIQRREDHVTIREVNK